MDGKLLAMYWTWSPEVPDDWEEFMEWYEAHRDELTRAVDAYSSGIAISVRISSC